MTLTKKKNRKCTQIVVVVVMSICDYAFRRHQFWLADYIVNVKLDNYYV